MFTKKNKISQYYLQRMQKNCIFEISNITISTDSILKTKANPGLQIRINSCLLLAEILNKTIKILHISSIKFMTLDQTTLQHQIVSNKWSLRVRLLLLIIMLALFPFGCIGLSKEQYPILLNVSIIIIFVWIFIEMFVKLLKPVSISLLEDHIIAKYLNGYKKTIPCDEISGYSTITYLTKQGNFNGIILYLDQKSHIEFTEINISDIEQFRSFLKARQVPYYGEDSTYLLLGIAKNKYIAKV